MDNRKVWKIVLVVMAIFIIVFGIVKPTYEIESKKSEAVDELITVLERRGLEDVEVEILSYDGQYKWWNVNVYCSNLTAFSYKEICKITDVFVYGLHVWKYITDGDSYVIFSSSRLILKNGEEIYNDYFHSDTHKEAIANKSRK